MVRGKGKKHQWKKKILQKTSFENDRLNKTFDQLSQNTSFRKMFLTIKD